MGDTSWCLGIYATELSDAERWITENENSLRFFQATRFIVTEAEFSTIMEAGRATYDIAEDHHLGPIEGFEVPASCRRVVLTKSSSDRPLAFFVINADIQYKTLWRKAYAAAVAWRLEQKGCEYYWKTDSDILLGPSSLARLSLLLPPRPTNSTYCHELDPSPAQLPSVSLTKPAPTNHTLAPRAKNKAPTYQFNNGPVVPCSFYIGRIWYKRIWLASGSFYGYSAGLLPRLADGAPLPNPVSEEGQAHPSCLSLLCSPYSIPLCVPLFAWTFFLRLVSGAAFLRNRVWAG